MIAEQVIPKREGSCLLDAEMTSCKTMAFVETPGKMRIDFLLNQTLGEGFKVLKCDQCNAVCRNEPNLRYHRFLHGDDRLHACHVCEVAFPRKFSLQSHVRCVHEKERRFRCASCKSRFFYRKDLQKHLSAVHEKLRPHRCEECNASFGKKEHLTRHNRSMHPHG